MSSAETSMRLLPASLRPHWPFSAYVAKSGVGSSRDFLTRSIADKGAWMSIWVDDVDAVHQRCLQQGLEATWPPTDMPWNVREMHVRHPPRRIQTHSDRRR